MIELLKKGNAERKNAAQGEPLQSEVWSCAGCRRACDTRVKELLLAVLSLRKKKLKSWNGWTASSANKKQSERIGSIRPTKKTGCVFRRVRQRETALDRFAKTQEATGGQKSYWWAGGDPRETRWATCLACTTSWRRCHSLKQQDWIRKHQHLRGCSKRNKTFSWDTVCYMKFDINFVYDGIWTAYVVVPVIRRLF